MNESSLEVANSLNDFLDFIDELIDKLSEEEDKQANE